MRTPYDVLNDLDRIASEARWKAVQAMGEEPHASDIQWLCPLCGAGFIVETGTALTDHIVSRHKTALQAAARR